MAYLQPGWNIIFRRIGKFCDDHEDGVAGTITGIIVCALVGGIMYGGWCFVSWVERRETAVHTARQVIADNQTAASQAIADTQTNYLVTVNAIEIEIVGPQKGQANAYRIVCCTDKENGESYRFYDKDGEVGMSDIDETTLITTQQHPGEEWPRITANQYIPDSYVWNKESYK